jgi:hypothetical protein
MNSLNKAINDYLWASYLPPNSATSKAFESRELSKAKHVYSISELADIFGKIFDDIIDETTSANHVVPLSGGIDSRAILGALTERCETNSIRTVTFGAPGQLDYEIGQKVSKQAGIKNQAIDLTGIVLTWESILASVKKSPWTGVPDGFFNQYVLDNFSNHDDLIWSGFLGGLTGDYINDDQDHKDEELINKFISRERKIQSIALCNDKYSPRSFINSSLLTMNRTLSTGSYLHYGVHNSCYTGPIVAPFGRWSIWSTRIGTLDNGAEFIAPFADPRWAEYWLHSPNNVRKQSVLFLEMLKSRYSKLFSVPTKQNYWSLSRSYPSRILRKVYNYYSTSIYAKAPWTKVRSVYGCNYVDYDYMFRNRKDYQDVLYTAAQYFKKKSLTPWLNIDQIIRQHMKYSKNYGDVFCVLIGLAANLQVNEI